MEQDMTLDIRQTLEIIKKRAWIIVATVFMFTAISSILSYFIIPPTYEAGVSLIVGKSQITSASQDAGYQYSDVLMYQQMVKTYAEIAKSDTVAQKASDILNNTKSSKEIQGMIAITPQPNTQVIDMKISDVSAVETANVANAVADALISVSEDLYPVGSIKVIDRASIPMSPVKPNPLFNTVIAFFAGIIVSLGIIFAIEYLDNTIKTAADVEKYLEIPVIGIIPKHVDA